MNETTHHTDAPGKLTDPERLRRVHLANRAKADRERHQEAKVTWSKTWKRRDEAFAELIDRLMREADTGWDEGAQLSLPGTEPELPPEAPVEVLTGRWAELARIDPPRITAWTLQEADLSPVASKLLGLLHPPPGKDGKDGKVKGLTVDRCALPELLGCPAPEALDAAAELLCLGLVRRAIGTSELATGERRDGLLRLNYLHNRNDDPPLVVLKAMLKTELDVTSPDYLLLEVELPRRVLAPLLEGLQALGAVEAVDVHGERCWRRVARVHRWEDLVLEALRRAEGVEHLARRVLAGCIDVDWTICGLVEAGVLVSGPRSAAAGQAWQIVDEAERKPLRPEAVAAMVKREVPAKKAGSRGTGIPLERLAKSLDLQAPTVRRACEALVSEGWLVEAKAPKGWHGDHYFGPWYERADQKAPKGKKKAKGGKAPAKAKAQPKKAAKHGKKDKPAPTRALGDVIDGVLRAWEGWLPEDVLLAKVREEMPLNAQPDRDWKGMLSTMIEQGRIERREEDGQTLYRTRPPAAPAVDWRRERQAAAAHIAEQHEASLPIGGDPPGTPCSEVLSYLEGAGALARGPRGWDYELNCEIIDEKRISEGVWRTGLDFLLDQIEESTAANGGVGPTVKALAELLEAPLGLVTDLVAELTKAGRVREVPRDLGAPTLQVLPSPKGKGKKKPAQDRTPPLFEGVEPAPAREEVI